VAKAAKVLKCVCAPAKCWRCEDCLTLPTLYCPELRSYPVRFADAVCCLLVPDVLLLVVSCCEQGDVWSIEHLAGQACRTGLLVHVSTEHLTCCCSATQNDNNHITCHRCEVELSSSLDADLGVDEEEEIPRRCTMRACSTLSGTYGWCRLRGA
jgi:hypothetical protein